MVTQPETVFQNVQSNSEEEEAIGDHIKMALLKDVRRRMTPQPLKIRAEVEITCFEYDGIEHIKAALKTAEKVSGTECDVKVSLVASPLYVFTTQTADKDSGILAVNQAISAASESITLANGNVNVKEPPRAVSERDERLLAEKIEKITEEATDSDSDGETMGSVDI